MQRHASIVMMLFVSRQRALSTGVEIKEGGMQVQHFFDPRTWTLTYVVHDEHSQYGIVIDSVLDFDPKSGRTWHAASEAVARYIDAHQLAILFVLDTHAHADHLSGMQFFKTRYGAQTVIGAAITQVQARFRDLFNLGREFPVDGRQFDLLLKEGDVLNFAALHVKALHIRAKEVNVVTATARNKRHSEISHRPPLNTPRDWHARVVTLNLSPSLRISSVEGLSERFFALIGTTWPSSYTVTT